MEVLEPTSFESLLDREYARAVSERGQSEVDQVFKGIVESSLSDLYKDYDEVGLRVRTLHEAENLYLDADAGAEEQQDGQEKVRLIMGAFAVGLSIHKDQKSYKGDPYWTHTSRVGIRILRDYRPNRDELSFEHVIAGFLHDSVEDQPELLIESLKFNEAEDVFFDKNNQNTEATGEPKKRAQEENGEEEYARQQAIREQAVGLIARRFGSKAAFTVRDVSNEISPTPLDVVEKRSRYYEKIQSVINEDFGVFVVKLSDFMENGVGLHHSDEVAIARRMAGKYKPVYQMFIDAAKYYSKQGLMTEDESSLTIRKLERGLDRANELLQAQGQGENA